MLRPLLQYVAPYQTVCNYSNASSPASQPHVRGRERRHLERILVRTRSDADGAGQSGDSANSRPADVPSNVNPQDARRTPHGNHFQAIHAQPYAPAIDAQGNADCQTGQSGYLTGPFPAPNSPAAGRYPPASEKNFNPDSPTYLTDGFYQNQAGGSHVVVAPNTPGRRGLDLHRSPQPEERAVAMALRRRRKKKDPRDPGMSPFKAG